MLLRKAFRYRLDPTAAQCELFRKTAGCVRFVWNWALTQRTSLWAAPRDLPGEERRVHRISAIDQINHLPALKHQFPFLADVPSHCLQQVLRDLEQAFARFLSGACRHPRLRRKGERVSFRFPDPKQLLIGDRTVFLPKAGTTRYRHSRPITGRVKQATVSWDGFHWFVSVLTEQESLPSPQPSGSPVGIDLGIAQSVTCSNGRVIQFPVPTAADLAKCARLQRRCSRRVKGSHRREKARLDLLRFRRHLINRRNDTMHKTSTTLAQNHGLVVIEDLSLLNMTASAAGTATQPGTNVRAKAGLNRSLLAQALGEFRRQLTYKTAWYGSRLVVVPPHHTSQRCAACGHVATENRPSQAVFRCVACGHSAHADHNAALNILAVGMTVSAQGAVA